MKNPRISFTSRSPPPSPNSADQVRQRAKRSRRGRPAAQARPGPTTATGTPWSAASTGSNAIGRSRPGTTNSPSATKRPSTSPRSTNGHDFRNRPLAVSHVLYDERFGPCAGGSHQPSEPLGRAGRGRARRAGPACQGGSPALRPVSPLRAPGPWRRSRKGHMDRSKMMKRQTFAAKPDRPSQAHPVRRGRSVPGAFTELARGPRWRTASR